MVLLLTVIIIYKSKRRKNTRAYSTCNPASQVTANTNVSHCNQMWQSSSRMLVINHNWSAMKQRPHPQSAAEISRHSVLSGDRTQ